MATFTRPGAELGGADERANFLKLWSQMTMEEAERLSVVAPYAMTKTISSGKSLQFPVIGRMEASELEIGAEYPGDTKPLTEERTIPIDNKPIIASTYVADEDLDMSHFEVMGAYSRKIAEAIAVERDTRVARMIALGARQDATGSNDDFKAGNYIASNTSAGTLAAAYPMSQKGATQLRKDLASVARYWAEQYRRGEKVAFLSPYLMDVARQDPAFFNKELSSNHPNDYIRASMGMLEGFMLVPSNWYDELNAKTGVSGGVVSSGESAYRGDFTQTAFIAVCGGMGSEAVGHLTYRGLQTGAVRKEDRDSTLLKAKLFSGTKWLDRVACAEVSWGTAYTLTNGVYIPS